MQRKSYKNVQIVFEYSMIFVIGTFSVWEWNLLCAKIASWHLTDGVKHIGDRDRTHEKTWRKRWLNVRHVRWMLYGDGRYWLQSISDVKIVMLKTGRRMICFDNQAGGLVGFYFSRYIIIREGHATPRVCQWCNEFQPPLPSPCTLARW